MTNTDMIGGVSPLKKGKWRGRRGKRGGTVGDTRYKRDKWVKPTGGGTTVKAPKAPNPKKPYTIAPDGKVQMTPPGDVNITEGDNIINQTNGGGYDTKTTTKKGKPSTDDVYEDRTTMTTYQQAWDKMGDADGGKKKNKFGKVFDNLEQFTKEAKAYNEKTGHTTKKTEKVLVKEGEEGTEDETTTETTYNAGTGNTANIYDYGHSVGGAVGKYKLGGYRAMKKNRK
tara:strand:+ start:2318 stop:2998 length:681 start_codon:yes stop_codon:yes gene_type:complete